MALAILFSACNTTNRTPKQKIEQQIDSLLKDKKATVGVAVLANGETVAVYNNQNPFPPVKRLPSFMWDWLFWIRWIKDILL